jgi:hypothetical protein
MNLKQIFSPDQNWIDVWESLFPDDHGFTFDSTRNLMLKKYEQMRYDRVLFQSSRGNWDAGCIEMVGLDQIENLRREDGTTPLFPSDHFGLLCHFRRNK